MAAAASAASQVCTGDGNTESILRGKAAFLRVYFRIESATFGKPIDRKTATMPVAPRADRIANPEELLAQRIGRSLGWKLMAD